VRIHAAAIAATLLLAACATASPPPSGPPVFPQGLQVKATGTPGQATASRYLRIGARVTAVDLAARTLTVETGDGATETIQVAPQANLEPFGVGDVIHVEYEQGLQLDYQPEGSQAVPLQISTFGNLPGGAASALVQATVTVTAIDLPSRAVEFRGPRGNLYRVTAGPKVPLERLKAGDRLLATYAESFAVRLEKAERPVPGI
jgi:hypothetical protein